jgi:uncharacterized membrane protein YbhN (UPF0104 family)
LTSTKQSTGEESGRATTGGSILRTLTRIPTPVIFLICVAIAVVVLIWQGQGQELVDVLRKADVGPMLLAAPIYVFSIALLCLRWHLLVRMAQGWSDLPRASEAFLTSVVINYAAPIGLAVPSRAALTKRALGLDNHATGTIAIWEIGFDVLILGLGVVGWLFLADGSTSAVGGELSSSAGQYGKWGVVALLVGLVVLIWLFRNADQRRRFIHFAQRILRAPMHRPGQALASIVVTAAYWILQGVVLALLVQAMNVETSIVLILGLTSLPMLVGMLSPIPGGAVVREAMMYVVARIADVPGGEVVAAAVIYRMALFGAIPILYALVRLWISRRGDGHPNLPRPDATEPA